MKRLIFEINEGGLVLDEVIFRDGVYFGKWYYVMFSYVEVLENTEEEEFKFIGRVSFRNLVVL